MYTAFFGLSETPFSIAPDPRFLFMSRRHREALAHLLYGVQTGGGFVQLTGEVGTGKTTLCRGFLEQLPDKLEVALILNPRLSEYGLVATVCDEFGLPPPPDGERSLKERMDRLNAHLLERHAAGWRSMLIIDEAQNLSTPVLEQLRLLTNLETNRDKLLRIVLIGQPELAAVLGRRELRQLRQRITARYHLQPLSRAETRAYVEYRLQVAGCRRPLFTRAALAQVYRYSGGIPRLINVICDRALLGAYSREAPRVSARMARRAAREVLGGPERRRYLWRRLRGAAVVVAAFAAGAGIAAATLGGGDWQRAGRDLWARARALLAAPAAAPADPLAAAAVPEGQAVAWLLEAWGLAATPEPGPAPCRAVPALGLRCLRGDGGWAALARHDRPAALRLEGGGGYLVVLASDGARLLLRARGGRRWVDRRALAGRWRGRYLLLWSNPSGADRILPGTYSEAVLWLRRRMNAIEGVEEDPVLASEDARYYDSRLQARVAAFQRARGLRDDGVVDAATMIQLNTALGSPVIPLLAGTAKTDN